MGRYDVIVIGGGPAGLAAALSASENGAKRVLILERDRELGGILNQCIHSGFGLHYFGEELTGPEYAARFIERLSGGGIEAYTGTMVLSIGRDRTLRAVSAQHGYLELSAGALVLAMGCRERTRGAIALPGDRPAGIFTAGAAQRYVNIEGYMVGRRAVVLGSGDIGLIMARRLTLEGAKVLACVELMPYSNGLQRNIAQCLNDFDIPLLLSHTVTNIAGRARVEAVTVSRVDESRRPIPGSEIVYDCDTLLLSVGLIPENELTRAAEIPIDPRTNGAFVYEDMETQADGIFACGNAVQVHDLVDYVTRESERAGAAAARYAADKTAGGRFVELKNGDGVSYTVPQRIRPDNIEKAAEVFFRVRKPSGPAIIEVADEAGVSLCRFQRERTAPGEMEKILLPKAALETARGSITVSVKEDEK